MVSTIITTQSWSVKYHSLMVIAKNTTHSWSLPKIPLTYDLGTYITVDLLIKIHCHFTQLQVVKNASV